MTNAQLTPAGWYPDASVPGQLRWWDGVQWTDRVQTAYSSNTLGAAGGGLGTATGTWQVWAINGLFALQMVLTMIYIGTIDWSAYMAYSMNPSSGDLDAFMSIFGVGYLVTIVGAFIAYIATAVLAYLDGKELSARGIDRPFHWAFTLIPSYGSTVYIIGRTVVVRRRAGGGLAPLWAYIAIFVSSMIASVIVSFAAVGSMFSTLPGYY